MRKNCKAKEKAAHRENEYKINACQIRREEVRNVWISVSHATYYPKNQLERYQIDVKCCHCWKLDVNLLKKVINRKILEKTVENIQIRTKKLKNGAILIY
jgi:hypothetical protein